MDCHEKAHITLLVCPHSKYQIFSDSMNKMSKTNVTESHELWRVKNGVLSHFILYCFCVLTLILLF